MTQVAVTIAAAGFLILVVGPFMEKANAKTSAKLLGSDSPAAKPTSARNTRMLGLVVLGVGIVLLVIGLIAK